MEATRQLEGLQGNDIKFRRMYQILHDKQPKGAWAPDKRQAGAVRLQLALYLMSQKHYEDAQLASRPFLDIPPYRDHPVANLIHGLIHYHQWYELVKQEVEQASERRVVGPVKSEEVDFSEGVGENEGAFGDNHVHKRYIGDGKYASRPDVDVLSESASMFDANSSEGNLVVSSKKRIDELLLHDVKEESQWNFYDDMDEENERSYMKKAKVVYTVDLDRTLFPFSLPRSYHGKSYVVLMGTVTAKGCHSNAIKHLREALSLDKHSTAALLPLVQLMLARADVEGAYEEIEKCCQGSSHCIPFRIKCMLLESLTPKNKDMLAHVYEEVLEVDPSSVHSIEGLIDMHKIGDYRTETLVQHLALHLDGCPGSLLVWRKLAFCFQKLKEAENEHVKEIDGVSEEPQEQTAQDALEPDFFQQEGVQEAWNIRERWWPVKHFRSECIQEESNAKGILWLVHKAASGAHIFGPSTCYVSEVEKHLRISGSLRHLAKLQKHKENSFNLLARFTIPKRHKE